MSKPVDSVDSALQHTCCEVWLKYFRQSSQNRLSDDLTQGNYRVLSKVMHFPASYIRLVSLHSANVNASRLIRLCLAAHLQEVWLKYFRQSSQNQLSDNLTQGNYCDSSEQGRIFQLPTSDSCFLDSADVKASRLSRLCLAAHLQ